MIYKNIKKSLIWIVLAIIVLVLMGVVIYLVWPKREANKPVEDKSQTNTNWEEQISQLKFELNSTKSKLRKSEINQKSQLEGKTSKIENKINDSVKQNSSLSQSEIKQLKEELKEIRQKLKENKPSNQKNDEPKPNQDEPSKNDKPKDDTNQNPNSDDLVATIFRWSGSDESGYWTFASRKERAIQVHIAEDHPSLKGKKLDSSEDTPLFSILFEKKNASKQEGNDTWYFDKDNNSFELDTFGDWPDEPEPNNKEEAKVKYAGINRITRDAYIFLLEGNKDHLYSINENHPCIKELLNQNKLQKDKKFTIRYEKVDKVDKKSDKDLLFTFNEDNKELEIIEFKK